MYRLRYVWISRSNHWAGCAVPFVVFYLSFHFLLFWRHVPPMTHRSNLESLRRLDERFLKIASKDRQTAIFHHLPQMSNEDYKRAEGNVATRLKPRAISVLKHKIRRRQIRQSCDIKKRSVTLCGNIKFSWKGYDCGRRAASRDSIRNSRFLDNLTP